MNATGKRTFSASTAQPSEDAKTQSVGVQTEDPPKPTVLLNVQQMVAIDEAIEKVLAGLQCSCRGLCPHPLTPDLQRAHDHAVWMQRIFDERRAEHGAHALPTLALADMRDRAVFAIRTLAAVPRCDDAMRALRVIIDTIDAADGRGGVRGAIPGLDRATKSGTFFEFWQTDARTHQSWTFWLTVYDLEEMRAEAQKRGSACLPVDFHSEPKKPKERPRYARACEDTIDIYQVIFPGRAVFYFRDQEIAMGFVRDYKSMAGDHQREAGHPLVTIPVEEFSVEKRTIPESAVVGHYGGRYTPGIEPDLRAEMKRDFQRYLARLK
jgi:hypothetical protein